MCAIYVAVSRSRKSKKGMKPEPDELRARDRYDFSKGRRGAVVPYKGKIHITVMLDNEVIDAFRAKAEAKGIGY